MIVGATNEKEWNAMVQFLNFYSGVQPSVDLKMIGWVKNNKLAMVVGFNGFFGKICNIHVAMLPEFHFTPKVMLKEVFNYVFNTSQRELVLGILNSNNHEAIRYDEHLGFTELSRIPGMHDEGGDVVVLGMYKQDCKYLEEGYTSINS